MLQQEMREAEQSLNKTKEVCKLINLVTKIVFVIFCFYWLSVLIMVVFGESFSKGTLDLASVNIFQLALYIAHGLVIAFLLVIFAGIFGGVAKGESPFTMLQVKKLRLIAVLLLIYALLDIAVASNSSLLQFNGVNSGYVPTGDNTIIPINLVPIFGAAVVYAFSFVFKYGVLLQEFSDETP